MMIRTYQELVGFQTFDDRFEYLKLNGRVGRDTFGFDRYMNQAFYRSTEWKQMRDYVIVRDNGCDLGHPDHEIYERPLVHHMNPMTKEDIIHGDDSILNPDFLITTTHQTHNAIHYGAERLLIPTATERRPGDTRLW